jgi:hypothetical protein
LPSKKAAPAAAEKAAVAADKKKADKRAAPTAATKKALQESHTNLCRPTCYAMVDTSSSEEDDNESPPPKSKVRTNNVEGDDFPAIWIDHSNPDAKEGGTRALLAKTIRPNLVLGPARPSWPPSSL